MDCDCQYLCFLRKISSLDGLKKVASHSLERVYRRNLPVAHLHGNEAA